MLAFASAVAVRERREDGDGGLRASEQVGNGHAGLLWRRAGHLLAFAGDAHEAAHALHDEVVAGARRVGAGLPEAGDGAVHQPGVLGAQRFVVQPVAAHVADLEVLHQHIALRHQLAHDLLAFGGGNVERDGALVAVHRQEVGGLGGGLALRVGREGRAPLAGVVALAGALDLDDIGPQVGQGLGAPGPGEHAGEVQNAKVLKRSHGVSLASRVATGLRPGASGACR